MRVTFRSCDKLWSVELWHQHSYLYYLDIFSIWRKNFTISNDLTFDKTSGKEEKENYIIIKKKKISSKKQRIKENPLSFFSHTFFTFSRFGHVANPNILETQSRTKL